MDISLDLVLRIAGALRAASVVAENDAMAAANKASYRNALEMSRQWRQLAIELEAEIPVTAANPLDQIGT